MTVGEKIKYYRNIRGISQEMLGNLSGINPATIKKYSQSKAGSITENHKRSWHQH